MAELARECVRKTIDKLRRALARTRALSPALTRRSNERYPLLADLGFTQLQFDARFRRSIGYSCLIRINEGWIPARNRQANFVNTLKILLQIFWCRGGIEPPTP